jgi:hypothetical protein
MGSCGDYLYVYDEIIDNIYILEIKITTFASWKLYIVVTTDVPTLRSTENKLNFFAREAGENCVYISLHTDYSYNVYISIFCSNLVANMIYYLKL